MINFVIPMAGQGSRFTEAGYNKPKPFIDVAGKPMIWRVLENLNHPEASFILIARTEHLEAEPELVNDIKRQFNATFITVDELTEGTACTVLHARSLFQGGNPLVIANSDQIVDLDIAEFIADCRNRQLDGSILTFIDNDLDPKWSFAKIDSDRHVVQVKEKSPISEYATVGIYLFACGSDFIESAIDMILAREKVNNEYYTCPVYNYLIKKNKTIGIFNINKEAMHGIGTPSDLNAYLELINSDN